MMDLPLDSEMPPIRVNKDGAARVGASRVSLDTVVYFHQQGATPEAIVRKFPTLEPASAGRSTRSSPLCTPPTRAPDAPGPLPVLLRLFCRPGWALVGRRARRSAIDFRLRGVPFICGTHSRTFVRRS